MTRRSPLILALAAHVCIAAVLHAQPQQTPAADVLRLEDIEKIALQKNPTLRQAEARVRAAQGLAVQAGLYPNPSVGATGEELAPGPVIRWGEIGFFVQHEIVLGGKLGKSRRTAEQDVVRARAELEAQRLKILNTARKLFYRALASQRKIEVRTRLSALVREAVAVSRQLQNIGQADVPDVLEIEVEDQRADVALTIARNEFAQVWRQLAAAIGDPELPPAMLDGDLEDIPVIDEEEALAGLLRNSPETRFAEAGIARADAALTRARVEKIPNLGVRGGLRYNRELLEPGPTPVGLEGFFDVGVRIPLFDRNQGAVAAARADLDAARAELERVRLSLRSRLAAVYRDYLDARAMAERYASDILPRAEKAYALYLSSYRRMAAAYPQVLIAQRTLFQSQEEYTDALARAWSAAIEIRGLLLDGGLDPPEL